MKGFIDKVIVEPVRQALQDIVAFLPSLLTGIVVFLIGLGLAWLVKVLTVRLIGVLRLDAAFDRSGVTAALKKMAAKDTPARLVGRMFFWLVTFIFFILALKVMKIPVIDQLFARFVLYVPNIFVALVILVLGWLLGNFLGRAALIASVNAGLRRSGLLSRGVKGLVVLFALAMAFEQLGIGRATIVAAFAIAFGGIVLALALALGLGGRDMAKTFLEKRFGKDRDEEDDGLKHL
jgi:hypothetical protein